jgi:hypothetical protein
MCAHKAGETVADGLMLSRLMHVILSMTVSRLVGMQRWEAAADGQIPQSLSLSTFTEISNLTRPLRLA